MSPAPTPVSTVPRPPVSTPAPEPRSDQSLALVDWRLLRDYLGFARCALARHAARAFWAFAATAVATGVVVWAVPRSYHVESKVLAQSNEVMPALGNPGRSIPGDADSPTRSASETVMRRSNLISLVHQTNLGEQWLASRAPGVRLKDAVVDALLGKPTDDERLEALVTLLEKRVKVTTPERAVVIAIDWPDAQSAFQLVEGAQQNFLETRHAMEVSVIAESISILETHASGARATVDQAMEEVRTAREARARTQRSTAASRAADDSARRPAARSVAPRVTRAPVVDPEAEQVRALLLAKRNAIRDLEEFRQRRLGELQGQLTEALATYAPAHPAVLTVRQTIDQMQHDSPQLIALRQEEQSLQAEFVRKGGRDAEVPVLLTAAAKAEPGPEAPRSAAVEARPEAGPDDSPSEELSVAEDRLRIANLKYEDLLGRIEAARIELDTARAAFKYRYSIVTPAQVPKRADQPNLPLLVGAGLVAALALAVAVAVRADFRSGRLLERWQVQRQLGLPILAEVDRL